MSAPSRIAALLALACLLALAGCGGSTDPTGTGATSTESTTSTEAAAGAGESIEGADGTFTLELPDNWSAAGEEQVQGAVDEAKSQVEDAAGAGSAAALEAQNIYVRDGGAGFNTTINVLTEPVPDGASFESAVKAGATLIEQSLPDAEIVAGPDETTLDGEQAFETRYTAAPQGKALEFALVQPLHDGTAYSITLTAEPEDFDDAEAEFRQILDSWSWSQ